MALSMQKVHVSQEWSIRTRVKPLGCLRPKNTIQYIQSIAQAKPKTRPGGAIHTLVQTCLITCCGPDFASKLSGWERNTVGYKQKLRYLLWELEDLRYHQAKL